jgi:hypothetical protein
MSNNLEDLFNDLSNNLGKINNDINEKNNEILMITNYEAQNINNVDISNTIQYRIDEIQIDISNIFQYNKYIRDISNMVYNLSNIVNNHSNNN